MSKPAGKCVFCGKGNLSKEHVWPVWMHEYLPEDSSQKHKSQLSSFEIVGGKKQFEKFDVAHRGPLKHLKLRRVCRDCNGGWMSEIETNAKENLVSLMLSERMVFTEEQIRSVAGWLALKTILFEYMWKAEPVATAEEYEYLERERVPPDNWHIWIGTHNVSTWRMRMFNQPTLAIDERTLTPPIVLKPGQCNTNTTSFGLGQLFAYIFFSATDSVRDHHLTIDDCRTARNLPCVLRIWPYCNPIEWPRSFFLNKSDLDSISKSLNINVPPATEDLIARVNHESTR